MSMLQVVELCPCCRLLNCVHVESCEIVSMLKAVKLLSNCVRVASLLNGVQVEGRRITFIYTLLNCVIVTCCSV